MGQTSFAVECCDRVTNVRAISLGATSFGVTSHRVTSMESPDLSCLDGLTNIGFGGGADMRPTLIRVLTDLYVQKLGHTADEERHYTELALRLLDAVDVASRVAVAERL